MKRTLSTITILISFGAAACGSKSDEARAPERVDGVTVETVALEDGGTSTESLGVVRAKTVSSVAAKLMATVVATPAEVGDVVRAGQLVLMLDDRDVAAQVAKANAGLAEIESAVVAAEAGRDAAHARANLATATYERYVALKQRGSVSPQEFDEVEAGYKAALAQREQADRMVEQMNAKRQQVAADIATASAALSWARIVSPIDGVVTARHIDVGSQAVPGMPLLTIENPGSYRVDTMLDETTLGRIRPGDRASVLVDSSGLTLDGTVSHVSPALDSASRSYLVKIDLPESASLTTGLTARVRFATGEVRSLTVPSASVVTRGQLTGVWIADREGLARLRFVKTGKAAGDRVEVLSGLAEGDRIVTSSHASLREGVKIAEEMPDSGSRS